MYSSLFITAYALSIFFSFFFSLFFYRICLLLVLLLLFVSFFFFADFFVAPQQVFFLYFFLRIASELFSFSFVQYFEFIAVVKISWTSCTFLICITISFFM